MTKACSFDGCIRRYHAKGFCGTHYYRFKVHGDASIAQKGKLPRYFTLLENFENNIEIITETGCWIWTAGCGSHGYGVMWDKGKDILTHRFSYEHFVGNIPNGLHCLHKCDIHSCCNPSHLFLGTHAENMIDMGKKGKKRGSKHHLARLTEQDVISIREAIVNGATIASVAKKYNVSVGAISGIKYGINWKHIGASNG